MASKSSAATTLFLTINLLFFTFVSSCGTCPGPKPTPTPSPSGGGGRGRCPVNTLKLGACANVLNGLISLNIGSVPKQPCCSLLQGLVDLEAAVCLCTVIRANLLGISLTLPVDLSLLLNYCGKNVPTGFQCP